jgi:hypothetical protein
MCGTHFKNERSEPVTSRETVTGGFEPSSIRPGDTRRGRPHHLVLLHLHVVLHQEAIDVSSADGAVQVWLFQKQLTLP